MFIWLLERSGRIPCSLEAAGGIGADAAAAHASEFWLLERSGRITCSLEAAGGIGTDAAAAHASEFCGRFSARFVKNGRAAEVSVSGAAAALTGGCALVLAAATGEAAVGGIGSAAGC